MQQQQFEEAIRRLRPKKEQTAYVGFGRSTVRMPTPKPLVAHENAHFVFIGGLYIWR